MGHSQLYVGTLMPSVISAEEMEDMLDFADIGGVYDNPALAAANTNVLQAFLDSRVSTPGIAIAFTGNRLTSTFNEKRQPGSAYFDLSTGPITYAPSGADNGSLTIAGLGGAKLIGQSAQTPTTPLFDIQRPIGGLQSFEFSNIEIQNGLGSGLHFWGNKTTTTGPGSRTKFVHCYFHLIGSSLGTPPTIDYDGWTDLDTAVYGLKLEEADGGFLQDCTFRWISGHGIIAKRWHEGLCHANCRRCTGSGLKAQEVQSTSLTFRAESNEGYGFHIRDTGNARHSSSSKSGSEGAPNAWDIWTEANNGRGVTDPGRQSSGFRYRQNKIDGSSRITVGGHIGWAENKFAVTEPTRRSVRLIQEDWIDPSVDAFAVLEYDMNNDGARPADGTGDNWATAWINAGDRPTLVTVGDTVAGDLRVQITIPAGAYDAAATTAWYLPVPAGHTISDASDGEMWAYTMELQVDQPGVDYCTSREALPFANRMQSYLGSVNISGITGASRTWAAWSTAKRKYSGRAFVEDAVSNMGIQTYVYINGMQDIGGTGLQYPESDIQLTIWSMKLYRIQP